MADKELPYPAVNWISGILMLLFMVPMIIMLVSFISSAIKIKDKKQFNIVLILSIIVNVLYLTTTILICTNEFVYILLVKNWKSVDSKTSASSVALYWGSQVMMISCFITRINQLLSSEYDIHLSKSTIRILYTSVITMIICYIITFIFVFGEFDVPLWLLFIPGILFILLYFSLTIVCLVIFIGKVNKLIVSINESYRNNEKLENDEMNSREKAIKHVIKHSVLVSIAILSSFFLGNVIYITTSTVMPNITGSDRDETGLFWLSIDCLISSTCVYLLFSFDINERVYNKLCIKLHTKCRDYKFKKLKLSETGVNLHNISSPIYDDGYHDNEAGNPKEQTSTINHENA